MLHCLWARPLTLWQGFLIGQGTVQPIARLKSVVELHQLFTCNQSTLQSTLSYWWGHLIPYWLFRYQGVSLIFLTTFSSPAPISLRVALEQQQPSPTLLCDLMRMRHLWKEWLLLWLSLLLLFCGCALVEGVRKLLSIFPTSLQGQDPSCSQEPSQL